MAFLLVSDNCLNLNDLVYPIFKGNYCFVFLVFIVMFKQTSFAQFSENFCPHSFICVFIFLFLSFSTSTVLWRFIDFHFNVIGFLLIILLIGFSRVNSKTSLNKVRLHQALLPQMHALLLRLQYMCYPQRLYSVLQAIYSHAFDFNFESF